MVAAQPLVSVGMPKKNTDVTSVWDEDDGEYDVYTTESVLASFHRSMVSGNIVAFTKAFSGDSLYASMSARPDDANFNFYSTYMTAGWRDNVNVNIKGLRDGQTVYDQNLVSGTMDRQFIT